MDLWPENKYLLLLFYMFTVNPEQTDWVDVVFKKYCWKYLFQLVFLKTLYHVGKQLKTFVELNILIFQARFVRQKSQLKNYSKLDKGFNLPIM